MTTNELNPGSGDGAAAASTAAPKPSTVADPGGSPTSRGLGEARARAAARGTGRDKGTGDGSPRAGDRSSKVSAPAPKPRPFTPDNVKPILAIPFHSAALYFDCEALCLDEDEEKALADTGALVANEYLPVDSKTAALTLFSLTLAGVVLTKAGIYVEVMRQRRKAAPPAPAPAASPHALEVK